MKIGVFSFNTQGSIRIDRLAQAAEARGFESLWVPEHTHIPIPETDGDPKSGMPRMPGGGFLPEEYRHMSDPFTSLAAAAVATRSLRLGTCICLVNQHHPLNLAKQVATLDCLSEGRFVFGVGAGWNVAEMAHHGIDFADRWRQLRERIAALRTLWNEEEPSFSGEYVRFGRSWQYPKPITAGGPPVVLGTLDTPFGRAQVARFGDGWIALTFDIERTRRSIEDLRDRMRRFGRDPDRLEVSLFFLADETQSFDTIAKARDLGATRVILRLPVAGEEAVLHALEVYGRYVERLT